jgi:shikimate kinase
MPEWLRGLLLIGMRGAGKSAAGRAAAIQIQSEFIDLDERALSLCAAASVAEVFVSVGGEARWRDAECTALAQAIAAAASPCIIAVGAGAPLYAPTADALRHARLTGWRVVHVRASPATCAARIGADPAGRPSITGSGVAEEIALLHAQRTPTYESLSDIAVDGDGNLDQVARSIARAASDS